MQLRHCIPDNHDRHHTARPKRNKADVVLHPRRLPLRPLATRLVPPWQSHLQGTHLSPSLSPALTFFFFIRFLGFESKSRRFSNCNGPRNGQRCSDIPWLEEHNRRSVSFSLSAAQHLTFASRIMGRRRILTDRPPVSLDLLSILRTIKLLPCHHFLFYRHNPFFGCTIPSDLPIYSVLTFPFRFQPHFRPFRSVITWLIISLRTLA